MVTVEKVRGGRYHHDQTGVVAVGDHASVSEELAAYLCDERGDFERVEGVTTVDFEEVGGGDTGPLGADPETMIDAGECPWCSDYEGENVGMHASRAHPDAWDDYTED